MRGIESQFSPSSLYVINVYDLDHAGAGANTLQALLATLAQVLEVVNQLQNRVDRITNDYRQVLQEASHDQSSTEALLGLTEIPTRLLDRLVDATIAKYQESQSAGNKETLYTLTLDLFARLLQYEKYPSKLRIQYYNQRLVARCPLGLLQAEEADQSMPFHIPAIFAGQRTALKKSARDLAIRYYQLPPVTEAHQDHSQQYSTWTQLPEVKQCWQDLLIQPSPREATEPYTAASTIWQSCILANLSCPMPCTLSDEAFVYAAISLWLRGNKSAPKQRIVDEMRKYLTLRKIMSQEGK
ncbi:hypothetical protein H4R34_000384 [Dimargaris verticillata]|uniref:Uncharacterized protein n=1 Tax=Dimargaris verticillata TaxID=2761393 RepID=A0A9W8B5D4_9FUNG|nr:hypothetical protein H4R34_000384 [Dimargaris verticillata]